MLISQRTRWLKCLKWSALGAFLFALVIVVGLPLSGKILTVDSGCHQANAIVVLGGDPGERTALAVEIYEAVQPQWVIISGSRHENRLRSVMVEHGIPEKKILFEDKSTSTYENAANTSALLQKLGATNVVVVTSWFHSRRALATFRHAAPGLTCYSVPTHRLAIAGIWPRADERRTILSEYAKILYYWVFHGVPLWV